MSSREPKRKPSMARRRAEYVARRDAAPDRSVYRRLPAEPQSVLADEEEGDAADQPVWPSTSEVTVTSQYQRPDSGFPTVLRTGLGRLVAILVVLCPLVVLVWVAYEYFRF